MKILYGVPGEGMGHATRSKVIISWLLEQGHDVQAVSSSRAYKLLASSFPSRVTEIRGFHLAYSNSEVSKLKTFASILKSAPASLMNNFRRYAGLKKSFSPDLVISDFESFTFFFAKLHRLPLISIDNMQVINRCRLDFKIPKHERSNHLIAREIIRAKVPGCSQYLITSFFKAKTVKPDTVIIPPILRDEIINTSRSSAGKHVLVYQTSTSQDNIAEILKNIPDTKFYVYGFNKDKEDKNVIFKAFSEKGFILDLASSKAVIANGGFSFISEAVYFQKPVCSIPIKNQFEQYVNAAYIEKLKFGRIFEDFSTDAIKAFLYDLEHFRSELKRNYRQKGNTETFKVLKKLLV